nr:hypothetical protein [Tanacetum cinerariifolium]
MKCIDDEVNSRVTLYDSQKTIDSGLSRILRLVVGGIVDRIVVENYRLVFEKYWYIAFLVEVAIVERAFVDRD